MQIFISEQPCIIIEASSSAAARKLAGQQAAGRSVLLCSRRSSKHSQEKNSGRIRLDRSHRCEQIEVSTMFFFWFLLLITYFFVTSSESSQHVLRPPPTVPPRNNASRDRKFGVSSTKAAPGVPPRNSKPFAANFQQPPPRPPKTSSAPPPVPSRDASVVLLGSVEQDEKIARLMALGYSFDHVGRALQVANNSMEKAIKILNSFVVSNKRWHFNCCCSPKLLWLLLLFDTNLKFFFYC